MNVQRGCTLADGCIDRLHRKKALSAIEHHQVAIDGSRPIPLPYSLSKDEIEQIRTRRRKQNAAQRPASRPIVATQQSPSLLKIALIAPKALFAKIIRHTVLRNRSQPLRNPRLGNCGAPQAQSKSIAAQRASA